MVELFFICIVLLLQHCKIEGGEELYDDGIFSEHFTWTLT